MCRLIKEVLLSLMGVIITVMVLAVWAAFAIAIVKTFLEAI